MFGLAQRRVAAMTPFATVSSLFASVRLSPSLPLLTRTVVKRIRDVRIGRTNSLIFDAHLANGTCPCVFARLCYARCVFTGFRDVDDIVVSASRCARPRTCALRRQHVAGINSVRGIVYARVFGLEIDARPGVILTFYSGILCLFVGFKQQHIRHGPPALENVTGNS